MTADGREMRSVGEALDRLVHELGLEEHRGAVAVHECWPEVAEAVGGAALAAHTEPRSLRDGVLTVAVDDPVWATQTRYLGPSLAASLNEAAGGALVREIRVVVAR